MTCNDPLMTPNDFKIENWKTIFIHIAIYFKKIIEAINFCQSSAVFNFQAIRGH